jgi:hypothetical protein
MTVPECLSVRPVAVRPSRRRAPARNAEVRVNADNDRGDAGLEIPNKPTFNPVSEVRGTRTIAHRPYSTPQAICRPLKPHS